MTRGIIKMTYEVYWSIYGRVEQVRGRTWPEGLKGDFKIFHLTYDADEMIS